MAQVEIIIAKDGSETQMHGDGFVGETCEEKMRPLALRLGTIVDSGHTPEFYDPKAGVDIGAM
jgi:hypothetical protein